MPSNVNSATKQKNPLIPWVLQKNTHGTLLSDRLSPQLSTGMDKSFADLGAMCGDYHFSPVKT